MRIGVNLLPLRPGRVGGAEVYVRRLLDELMRQAPGDRFVLVTAEDNHESLRFAHPNHSRRLMMRNVPSAALRLGRALARFPGLATPLRALGGRVRGAAPSSLSALLREERLDLWFCPFTELDPRPLPIPGVITVYDLQHETYPQFFAPAELAARRRFYPASCRAADRVLAISEFTRQQVIERYGLAPERVVATPLFPAAGFEEPVAQERVVELRRRLGLPPRYLFYPAHTWPHKNHLFLLEAFDRYRSRRANDLALVLSGASFQARPALEEMVDRHDLRPFVHLLGHVPERDLPPLFAGAEALVFPSLFEGFGIPLVEAMCVGCPIAAADATSVREVVGDAALLYDPRDVDQAVEAIDRLLTDGRLREELTRRGRARAQEFSVARTARLTREAFVAATQTALGPVIVEEGILADRWVQRAARFRVVGRATASVLHLEGEAPNIAPILPMALDLWVDGGRRRRHVIERAGPFHLTVSLEPGGELRLHARRTFRPSRLGLSRDDRDLSVRIHRVYLEPEPAEPA